MKSLKEIFDQADYIQATDVGSSEVLSPQNDNWNDHFAEGEKYLEKGNVNLAEQSVSRALKILSASPKPHHFNEDKAKCLHVLGDIYFARISQDLTKEDRCEILIKSIALYEAERIYKYGTYTEDERINRAVSEAELELLKILGPEAVQRFQTEGDRRLLNREKLAEIRSKITNEYFPTLASSPEWGTEHENRRSEAIEGIYKEIQVDMKSFIGQIFDYCSEIAGPAPCKYSVLGLGSTSRKEATPYSDLEFAILLSIGEGDDSQVDSTQRQYFRLLTYFIQAEFVKLGETMLPSLGIPSLNDFYSKKKEDDWFYDDMVPNGFSFDGMMPWACKTPLGKKAWQGKPPQEYIMTIDEMLQLQNIASDSSGDSAQTANVFSNVCHLYGDADLTEDYQRQLAAILTDNRRVKSFRREVLKVMENVSETYQMEHIVSQAFGTQQDVKKEVYRSASLLIEQLSKFFGIFGRSSWECINEMKDMLTEDGAKNLLIALSITTELRLRCYHKHGRQKEALPTVPQLSIEDKESSVNSSALAIVRLYQSLLPLKHFVSEILENQESDDVETVVRGVLQRRNFLDVSPFSKALAYLRILHLPKALRCLNSMKNAVMDDGTKVEILLVLAHCYRLVGRFHKVFECCREVQDLYSSVPVGTVKRSDLLCASTTTMLAYMDLGLYSKALKIHEHIMNHFNEAESEKVQTNEDLEFLNNSAVLFKEMEQYKKAKSILHRIIEKIPNPRKNYYNYFLCINNLAAVLLEEGQLREAKVILENALPIAKELYGETAVHSHVACCLINLSKVLFGLRETQEANNLLQSALIIYHRVHGQQLIEPTIVEALITKARAYQFAGKWQEMHGALIEAKEIARLLYADQPHPSVARVLFLLGCNEQSRGRFSTALAHFQECLKIREDHEKESGKSGYNCETAAVLLRIAHHGKLCGFEGSYLLSLTQKALEMEEQVHGKASKHSHLAMCFSNLGYRLMQETEGVQGMDFIEKAIKMFEDLGLTDTYEFGHTQLTMGIVLRDFFPHKAEKHLRITKDVLEKIFKDEGHIQLLEINSSLLRVHKSTGRIEAGIKLAGVQRRILDKRFSKPGVKSSREFYQVLWLCEFYEACGQRNTAKTLYTDIISRLESQIDPNNPEDEQLMFLLWITQEAVAEIYQSDEKFEEAEAMFQRCVRSIQKSSSQKPIVKEARLIAQWHLASNFTRTGRDSQAYEILSNLIKMYEDGEEMVDPMLALSTFRLLGDLHLRRGRLNVALENLYKAMKMAEDLKTRASPGIMKTRANEAYVKIMNTVGLVYEHGNDPKRALECYQCCLDSVREEQPNMDTATFHQNVADTLKKLGRMDDALTHYKKSLEIREMLHSEDLVREDIATVLYHIALTQFMCEKPKEASETLEKLLPLRQNLLKRGGSLQNYCATLILQGGCYIMQPDEAQKAKETYEKAEKILKKMTEGQPSSDYATVLSNIGVACKDLNQLEEAISKFREALQMKRIVYQDVKSPAEVATACFLLAAALRDHGEYSEALLYYQEAMDLYQAENSLENVVRCLHGIALCYKSSEELDKAVETFDKAEELCSTSKEIDDEFLLCFHQQMADVFAMEQFEDRTKTLHHLQKAMAILERKDKTEECEELHSELQAKILSLQF